MPRRKPQNFQLPKYLNSNGKIHATVILPVVIFSQNMMIWCWVTARSRFSMLFSISLVRLHPTYRRGDRNPKSFVNKKIPDFFKKSGI
ncbi:hypothetical protein [Nostoc sp. FACHB-280]|uniref:hypothetical protein n=1 Tax=Nostoc sp. FACHB-280 TaxID=2692839 RepID=UPI00168BD00D|nr:hypothetical protein [Nostoc sp. FACHB-280]MBD2496224.1 hypothetical protein [Nostoc sp. FACHB-280]